MKEFKLSVGPIDKEGISVALREGNICLNGYAEAYMSHPGFTGPIGAEEIKLVICPLEELGAAEGCTFGKIDGLAARRGLRACRPWVGPLLRLAMTEQEMSRSSILSGQHKAPDGAVTVFSKPLSGDDAFPKGLYLRHVEGRLWLRGYVCDGLHVWSGKDLFVFENKC